jgi:hypothetical protein
LRYLLLSQRVRQPPNHFLVEHYVFEVNILRVNRSMNLDGASVLYGGNMFVKFTSDFKDSLGSMRNHEVPFFHLKTAFDQYIADISTAFSSLNKRMPASMKLKKPLTFLLVIADVDKYARLLRLLDFANFMAYEFRFSLHQPPFAISRLSTLAHSELLVAFERLRGVATCQTVSLVGPFHPKTVKRVKQAMTQNVAWLRVGAWEIYEIAFSIKRMGDWAFLLKNADMALAKYHDTHSFMDTARALNSMMEGADLEFEKAFRTCCHHQGRYSVVDAYRFRISRDEARRLHRCYETGSADCSDWFRSTDMKHCDLSQNRVPLTLLPWSGRVRLESSCQGR